MTRDQAEAFLKALHPEGEHCYLASHARTYFEAQLGRLPVALPTSKYHEDCIALTQSLGKALIDLGNALMSEAMKAKQH